MRTMLKAAFPVESSNKAIKDGTLMKTMEGLMKELRPESAYFTTGADGRRACYIVFDMKDSTQLPVIAEPLFMNLNATVEFYPVMNAEDLKAGLEKAAKAWGRVPVAA